MPLTIDWLTGPPHEPGFYWYTMVVEDDSGAVYGPVQVAYYCRYVHSEHTDKCRLVVATTAKPVIEYTQRRWAGPLPEPPQVKCFAASMYNG